MSVPEPAEPAAAVLVACLCAAWCGSCRDYRPVFESLAARFAGRAEFTWVDIEDEADALGDLDVENFPTLMIAMGDAVLFLGPVAPQLERAARLVQGALDGEVAAGALEGAPRDLAARVRALA